MTGSLHWARGLNPDLLLEWTWGMKVWVQPGSQVHRLDLELYHRGTSPPLDFTVLTKSLGLAGPWSSRGWLGGWSFKDKSGTGSCLSMGVGMAPGTRGTDLMLRQA